MRSLLALHAAMSGTKFDGNGGDEISHSVADNPLFYVDGAGDTAFGRSVALGAHRQTSYWPVTIWLLHWSVCLGWTCSGITEFAPSLFSK